jgi:hypothetical protein
VDVPDSDDATFQPTSDGKFHAFDTVNGMSGTYTATRTGFIVTPTVSTTVAYTGTDPTRLAVIASMDAVFWHNYRGAVAATTTGTTLTLNRANYQLTFEDIGPAASQPSPSATPTTTPTHS